MKKLERMKNNLKQYRVWKDLTQRELAKELNIGVNFIQRIENENYLPKYQIRMKICNYFNVIQDQMFGDDEIG